MAKVKTFVIGGTGYLGEYIVEALLKAGHQVTVLSRAKRRAAGLFGRRVKIVEGDLASISAEDWPRLLQGQQNLAFAAGIDERVAPEGDPLAFYCHENVTRVRPILRSAAVAGIDRVALLNSIFSTLDRIRPDVGLAQHHPYIASRVQQCDMVLEEAKGNFVATVLEIPWVFGDARGRESQWQPLVQFARTTPRLFAPRGGTVVISAANVGRATVGALTYPKRSSAVPIGDQWLSWESLLQTLVQACGRAELKVTTIPDSLLVQFNEISGFWQKLFRLRSGLDYGKMHQFLLDDEPVNLRNSQKKLGYTPDDIEQALTETAENVPESKAVAAIRKLMS